MIDHSQLTHLGDLTWPDVFEIWRKNEADSEAWRTAYTARGFDSWAAWRMSYAEPLKLPTLSWALYQVDEPVATVPQFFGGPF